MKQAAGALIAITLGVVVGFWIAPPFGSFAILGKTGPK